MGGFDISNKEWTLLLEQASDLNDELCRENCELHREVSGLRVKKKLRCSAASDVANSAVTRKRVRAARAAELLPRVISHVRRALRPSADTPGCDGLALLQEDEALAQAVEDAVRRVLDVAAEGAPGLEKAASSEETAALIQEKVTLKEVSLLNQERIFELELAKDRLLGADQSSFASRLLNNVLQGSLAESAVPLAGSPTATVAAAAAAAAGSPRSVDAERPPEPSIVAVGSEHEVVGRKGAILRMTEDLDSDKVATLPPGSRVRIIEVGGGDGRRARVQALAVSPGGALLTAATPSESSTAASTSATDGEADLQAASPSDIPGEAAVEPTSEQTTEHDIAPIGWLSVTTKDGKALLRPVVAHEAPSSSDAPADDGPAQQASAPDVRPDAEGAGGMAPPADAMADISAAAAAAAAAGAEVKRIERLPSIDEANTAGTVTVSTDAWLALRNERHQREQQIRALEVQVSNAQREIRQLAEIRSQLKVQRAIALGKRKRGDELHETARMATEELHNLRAAEIQRQKERAEQEALEAEKAREEAARAEAEAKAAAEAAAAAVDDEAAQAAAAAQAEEEKRRVEWKRLCHERESTANQLAEMFMRSEELETSLEDRRVELVAAEKRREREKRSLLTALRELDWTTQGVEDEDAEDLLTEDAPDSTPKTLTTAGYIQRISELEDACDRLRSKLETVNKRESVLNENATVRGAALRYAATAAGRSMDSLLENAQNMPGTVTCLPAMQVQTTASCTKTCTPFLPPAAVKPRADLEGLSYMLEDLFVENFALRNEVLGAMGSSIEEDPVESQFPSPPKRTHDVDLTNFIKSDQDKDDDDDDGSPGRRDPEEAEDPEGAADASTPRNSEYWPESPLSLPSPRMDLSDPAKAFALDFTDMSVAES